ncbi:sporulation initiation factor Spo0A C-terminal domain-containing protein [Lachnospiraceae bacterium 66-29]
MKKIIAYNQNKQAIIVYTMKESSMSMRKIYRELAKKHGASAKEVQQEMQAALTEAYTDPLNNNEITKAYQNRVPRQGAIPTPEEAVRYLAGKVKKNRA